MSQVPNGFSYQAVVRDNGKTLLKNQNVKIEVSILRNEEVIFTQTKDVTTNDNGLLSIIIGETSDFKNIDWADGILFIQTRIDPSGGNNFTIETTSQLLSVPYAMAAQIAFKVPDLDLLIEKVNRLEEELEALKELVVTLNGEDNNDEQCNCIMDILKGEWSWKFRHGGFFGNSIVNEFKSVIKFISQNNDSTINYEIFVEDSLSYQGNFQIQEDQFNKKTAKIILPHEHWGDNTWHLLFYDILDQEYNNETGQFEYKPSNEDLIFWDGAEDGYMYHYKKVPTTCDKDVIVSQTEYQNAPDHFVVISDMNITGNCLKIKFSASGCSGNTWVVNLIDSEEIAESLPVQRTLRLSLYNQECCEAWITKEISFNIKDLQINGNNSVILNIMGTPILYEY